ncbi:putative P2Y purinoceptor 10 [Genypterus blacodes]|uniref:putative P2Y purinoceptor 10 n=1 Tax=Genypterus blacodes TaxID=154954 RepID=UPI003F758F45
MMLNKSGSWGGGLGNSTPCSEDIEGWEKRMDQLYTYFYLLLFIPGLLLNTTALWVLCRHISKQSKAVIFMVNLALADLAHVLSLPLRIYYYFTHMWPFGRSVCLICFYLKYLNMYASIAFLVCISVQRCVFLHKPFTARRWRKRYDLFISALVWLVVGLGCSPFIVMRMSSSSSSSAVVTSQASSYALGVTFTHDPLADTKLSTAYNKPSLTPLSSSAPSTVGCFKDLPTRRLPVSVAVTMIALGELFGFLLPLVAISYSSIRIARSLNRRNAEDQQSSAPVTVLSAPLNPSARQRLHSVLSNSPSDKAPDSHADVEKRRALQMVLGCFALFLLCFAPYHLNFLLYLMVSQEIVEDCAMKLAVRQFHPVSLCLASLSCCLNPLLYYFLTAEFRSHLSRRTASFTSSLHSASFSPAAKRPAQQRLLSMESSISERE